MILTLIATSFAEAAVIALLLLIPAGTVMWWRAWVLIALLFGGTLASSIDLLNVNPELLRERLKPPIQQAQTIADKVLLPALLAAFAGLLIFSALDVFRFHLLPKPNVVASGSGLILFFVGWWLAYRSMRENTFAAPVVKYQGARDHVVVTTGPYRIVRHPMYAGGSLLIVGIPLWLESTAGIVLTIVPIALLVARTLAEERFLLRELHGYNAYAQRVRYRLIPFVW